jgi:hypothetical protein
MRGSKGCGRQLPPGCRASLVNALLLVLLVGPLRSAQAKGPGEVDHRGLVVIKVPFGGLR